MLKPYGIIFKYFGTQAVLAILVGYVLAVLTNMLQLLPTITSGM